MLLGGLGAVFVVIGFVTLAAAAQIGRPKV
jgi:hypothetical protein